MTEVLIRLIVFLSLIYALFLLATEPEPYESNETRMGTRGHCVDCDKTVELTQQGSCCYCLSDSILKRNASLTGIQKTIRRMKR